MWLADTWSEYELLDCTAGERLERWGEYTLVRPDPQVIWHTLQRHKDWRKPDAIYKRSDDGGGHWLRNTLPAKWHISNEELTFQVGITGFKHTGLFPEQVPNWRFIQDRIRKAGRPVKVLNLFAYTGGATLAAASAGASVTHVDAAKGMVQWARENAALSGLTDRPVRWIVDDCAGFVGREIRRGKRYDALILDPPSFGRGPNGQTWRLEDNLYELLTLCAEVLVKDPLFVLLNTYTTGLSAGVLAYLLDTVFGARFDHKADAQELGLPISTGGRLPCGASGRLS